MTSCNHREPQREMTTPGIEEAIGLRLQQSSYLAIRNVHCLCRDGVLILRGSMAGGAERNG
jgi:hypothetical protein